MKSIEMRNDPLFMRNCFQTAGKYGLPIIRRQDIDLEGLDLIAYSRTKSRDTIRNRKKGVHFFIDDYRFSVTYNHPSRSVKRLSQYAFLLTPDFSTYAEMDYWRQLESIAHSRWVGAYWQNAGLTVIATISWSTPRCYDFCFDAVEKNAVVAIGMIGCKPRNHTNFLRGYEEMLARIEPKAILCYGEPYPEMSGNLIVIPYSRDGKEAL